MQCEVSVDLEFPNKTKSFPLRQIPLKQIKYNKTKFDRDQKGSDHHSWLGTTAISHAYITFLSSRPDKM